MSVFFHSEDLEFTLKGQKRTSNWILEVVKKEGKTLGPLNIIFSSNEYLLKINQDYLNHNYFTDVITFNYNAENQISGDIFVSIDQVKINCEEEEVEFYTELNRVMIHGLLHLLGYNDSNEDELKMIRGKEDTALLMLEGIEDEEQV